MRDNSLFSNHQQQQNLNNPGMYESGRDLTEFHEWSENNINSHNKTGLEDAHALDSSINILV